MTEGRELQRIRLVRGDKVLPLDDPGVSWHIESGVMGVFAASRTADGLQGRRQFLFEVGPGETLFGIGPTAGDRPDVVAVAIEECRLSQAAGAAPGAEAELTATGDTATGNADLLRNIYRRNWPGAVSQIQRRPGRYLLRNRYVALVQDNPFVERSLERIAVGA